MLGVDMLLRDLEDPLEGHPRYEKIRWADCHKDNVQIALDRQSNKNVAIKFFRRGPAISDGVRREILHHAQLHHVNVIGLHHVFLTSSSLCISLELGSQNLWEYVHSCGGCLQEQEAQSIFIQLVEGVHYCHTQGVANRDIKLENCLVTNVFRRGTRYTVVKICDFGHCKNVHTDSMPNSIVGTAAYVSPDILRHTKEKGYDALLVDIWSCGVVLYFLLEGRFPFGTELSNGGVHLLWERIRTLDYDAFEKAGCGAQDLLSKIFCPPELRINMDQLRDHWWVLQGGRRDEMKQLRSLHNQSSSSNLESQSTEEMEQLINEACVVPQSEATKDDPDIFLT